MLASTQPGTNTYIEPTTKNAQTKIAIPAVVKENEKQTPPEIIEEPIVESGPSIPDENPKVEFIEIEDKSELPDPNLNKPKPAFAPGYYVVLGAFEIYDNAISYSNLLNGKGIKVNYGYVEDRGLYYVYNIHTDSMAEATLIQNQFQKIPDFKDAWVHPVK